MMRTLRLFSWVFASFLVTGCRPPWDHYPEITQIAPDYTISTSSPGCTMLDRGGHLILGPHLQRWERRGDYLIGEVVSHSHSSPDLTSASDEIGFFILNLTTGQLTKGLQKDAYAEQIKSLERQ